jgi:hypothetical protein
MIDIQGSFVKRTPTGPYSLHDRTGWKCKTQSEWGGLRKVRPELHPDIALKSNNGKWPQKEKFNKKGGDPR